MMGTVRGTLAVGALVAASLVASAAAPPSTVNYQGVLRNASDKPLTGTYDMTFRFYDALSGGNEVLVDTHAAAGTGAVSVSGGLFNTLLGGGTVTDGAAIGTYTSLADVFRDYGAVYVGITVGAETLVPRVKVQSSAYALNATNLNGRAASAYVDTSATRQIKSGTFRFETADPATAVLDVVSDPGSPQAMWVQKGGNVCKLQDGTSGIDCTAPIYGVKGSGATGGGYFAEASGNSALYAGSSGFGANGIGNVGGAYFSDTGGSSAYAAHSGNGIEGYGHGLGGHFGNTGNASSADLATIGGYGITAVGTSGGASFFQLGGAHATLGFSGYGVEGFGSNAGGYFSDSDDGANAYIGSNGWGVYASAPSTGSSGGGFFVNGSGNAYSVLGTDLGSAYGGPYAIKAVVNAGVGEYWPGDFVNAVNGLFTRLAYNGPGLVSSSIWGNGTKNFAQNHPFDATKTITYAALEGDEAGTYTRGSGRLVNGEARIKLGETFAWVTNPDVGLTAQLTPRGTAALLYAVSLTPTELVVRSASGDPGAAFDYIVHGLRLGFEQFAVVTDRTPRNDAKLPDVTSADRELAKRPDLASFTPLARFRSMSAAAGLTMPKDDMARALALRASIGEYDRSKDAEALTGPAPKAALPAPSPSIEKTRTPVPEPEPPPQSPMERNLVEVAERVTAGDVLALDAAAVDGLRLARDAATPTVVGIVGGETGASWTGVAPIVLGGSIVLCHVDATYGAISPGDLLVASATPGYAMRAGDGPREGRVVAKALEAWPSGTGMIRVLVMAR